MTWRVIAVSIGLACQFACSSGRPCSPAPAQIALQPGVYETHIDDRTPQGIVDRFGGIPDGPVRLEIDDRTARVQYVDDDGTEVEVTMALGTRGFEQGW